MTRLDRLDREVVNTLPQDFLDRLQTTIPSQQDIDNARRDYGGLPDDVLEEIARQQAAARPILEQYHLLSESAPTLVIARATMQDDIDSILDIVVGMDLANLDDVGEFEDEYTCPKCAHGWSGAPNWRTGYKGKVFVPTGRVSTRTGRVSTENYNVGPRKTQAGWTRGRAWQGASAEKLPRDFGNKPIGTPIVGKSWQGKKRRRFPSGE
jgi:hypothetical protein